MGTSESLLPRKEDKESEDPRKTQWRAAAVAKCEDAIRHATQYEDPFMYSCPVNYVPNTTAKKKWVPDKVHSAAHIEALWNAKLQEAREDLEIPDDFVANPDNTPSPPAQVSVGSLHFRTILLTLVFSFPGLKCYIGHTWSNS